MFDAPLFTPDTHIVTAGQRILAAELATILSHQEAILGQADTIAVHETRKSLRRSFTAYRLFGPYLDPELIKPHKRRWRKIMRRLGRCRDTTIFLQKLALDEEIVDLPAQLQQYWLEQQQMFDADLQSYLGDPDRQAFVNEYAGFLESPAFDPGAPAEPPVPEKVRHVALLMLYQKLAAVRAFEGRLADVPLEQFHRLRIQFKELRYTSHFFAPLMGEEMEIVDANLETFQDILGELNDATVALRMLDQTPGPANEIAPFRIHKQAEISQLINLFHENWHAFDSPAFRLQLARATAIM